jgi:GDSL-like Lipase/Acylhydrolase family
MQAIPVKGVLLVVVAFIAAALGALAYTMGIGSFAPGLELNRERFFAIQGEIKATPAPIVLFGDSIVEGARLPSELCGHAVVNAGVTGSGIEYFQRHAQELLGSSRPELIVLAVGINNARPGANNDFKSRYHETVALLSRIAPVVVATVTPVQAGTLAAAYDARLVAGLNEVIKLTPNATRVIDLNGPLSKSNLTIDGVHVDAAGYVFWTEVMIEGISAALGCRT